MKWLCQEIDTKTKACTQVGEVTPRKPSREQGRMNSGRRESQVRDALLSLSLLWAAGAEAAADQTI